MHNSCSVGNCCLVPLKTLASFEFELISIATNHGAEMCVLLFIQSFQNTCSLYISLEVQTEAPSGETMIKEGRGLWLR